MSSSALTNVLMTLKCMHVFLIVVCFAYFQGQVMFRNGERMGTIKFNQFQGIFLINLPLFSIFFVI